MKTWEKHSTVYKRIKFAFYNELYYYKLSNPEREQEMREEKKSTSVDGVYIIVEREKLATSKSTTYPSF